MNKKVWKYLALTVAILMATVSVSGCIDPGTILGSNQIAAESDSFKLTENHVDVYRYHAAQNQLNYEYMYIRWGMISDPTGGDVKSGEMDAAAFIHERLPDLMGKSNFDATAYGYAKQYLTYCEGAKEAGLYDELREKAAADVDAYMEELEKLAGQNKLSLSKYITGWIGKALDEEDVRTAMEYYYVGTAYANHLMEQYAEQITEQELQAYVSDHKASFYTSTVVSYKLINTAMMDRARNCTTVNELKTLLVDYYLDQKFEAQYKVNITDMGIADADKEQTRTDVHTTLLAINGVEGAEAVFTEGDTEAYPKTCYSIVSSIHASVKTQTDKIVEAKQPWADVTSKNATDLQKWLFYDGSRRIGDCTVIKAETTDKDGAMLTTTFTWYMLVDHMTLDTSLNEDGEVVWSSNARQSMAGEQLTAWYNEAAERIRVTVNYVFPDTDTPVSGFHSSVQSGGDYSYSVITPSEGNGFVTVFPSDGNHSTTITPSEDSGFITVFPSDGNNFATINPSEGSGFITVFPSDGNNFATINPSGDAGYVTVAPEEESNGFSFEAILDYFASLFG